MVNPAPLQVAPRPLSPVIEVPAEVWRAGSASRASALGSRALPVEAIAQAARTQARRIPGFLRGLGGRIGPSLALGLGGMAVEWAAEWLLDEVIRPYQSWPTGQTTFPPGVGFRVVTRWRDKQAPPPGIFEEVKVANPDQVGAIGGAGGPFQRVNQFGPATFVSVGIPLLFQGGIVDFRDASGAYAADRYDFIGITSWELLGLPGGSPQDISDPYAPPRPPYGQELFPPVPLAPPFPATPNPVEVPGFLTPRFPGTTGLPRPGYDFDWLPTTRPGRVPQPGLRVGFRPGGVIVTELLAEAIPELARELLPELIEDSGGGDCPDPCTPIDYNEIEKRANKALDDKFPPRRPVSRQMLTRPAQNSHTIILPPFPRRAVITATEWPTNSRSQPGGSNAPDVLYLGWHSVGYGGVTGQRVPINYVTTAIPLADEATRLTVTGYAGVKFEVRVEYLTGA